MNDVDFPGWRPEKSIQEVKGNGRTRVIVKGKPYMSWQHKHLINYTPGYVLEELEEQPLVDNPEVRELKKQRAGLVSELNTHQSRPLFL